MRRGWEEKGLIEKDSEEAEVEARERGDIESEGKYEGQGREGKRRRRGKSGRRDGRKGKEAGKRNGKE